MSPNKTTQPQPLKLPSAMTLGELLALKLQQPRPIISPWFNAGEHCLLWAATGIGKSMFAHTLALAAAGGGATMGWHCPEPTRVLIVDGEQSVREIQQRLKLLPTAISGFDPTKAAENLVVMAQSGQANPGGFLDIANTAHHRGFADYIKKRGFGLVVLDNLSTLTASLEDENSSAAMKPMQTLLTHLKKLNVAVMLVHHTGKNATRFRGSSAIATTFERIIGITANEQPSGPGIDVVVTFEKYRDKEPEGHRRQFPLKFTTEKDGDGVERAAWVVGGSSDLDTGWEMYSTGPYLTKIEFLTAFDTRFGTHFAPGNFGRLVKLWLRAGITAESLEKARQRMDGNRAQIQAAEEPETAPVVGRAAAF